eukprot:CAMPEP_0113961262 /NCGR_PEP_ID=MMETSP0011_2-20120614/5206_1 /TAXON_ID=101924 /ORGANISM="Rhodosorus marinus" /LENGTH=76 /DNA_ID=CAMNT_0000972873 /DNA_START=264 /DNA_END=494 /DNA_ORIENTATION=- /assembly_acc=CAM_ASM_000156
MALQDAHPPALNVKHPNHSVVSSRYHMASIKRFNAPDWPRIIDLATSILSPLAADHTHTAPSTPALANLSFPKSAI